MIFLKKIELIGFKSFADKTIINFSDSITGIVGPNGSGKSNINDAIRWVFGEGSSKMIRSNNSEDIIFSGTQVRAPSNICDVKLIFDNTNSYFDLDFKDVVIQRRIYRNESESEYYINNTRVKLKEIKLLAKDSGMNKTSLNIISQGNVSQFAEAKPAARRLLLEDAAGILKYKQHKLDSINKLKKTDNNLSRIKDIINEIERQLPILKKQYQKAKLWESKNKRLKQIEINILTKDIIILNDALTQSKKAKHDLENEQNSLNVLLLQKDNAYNKIQDEYNQIDTKVTLLNKKYQDIINEVSSIKIKKIELENENQISESKSHINNLLSNCKELKYEYDLGQERINNIEIKIKDINAKKNKINDEQWKIKIKSDGYLKDIENINKQINLLNTQKFYKNNLFEGVKNILQYRNHLTGILDIVKNILTIPEKYQKALSIILNSVQQNIIVNNEQDAKLAIEFLKKNRSGKATFMPLTIKNHNTILEQDQYVMESIKGYEGVALDLVSFDNKYHNVVTYLLSKHILCKDLDSALKLARLTNYKYTFTVLDGNQVRASGILIGGYHKNNNIFFDYDKKISELSEELKIKQKSLDLLKISYSEKQLLNKTYDDTSLKYYKSLQEKKDTIDNILKELNDSKSEYQFLTSKKLDDDLIISKENKDLNSILKEKIIIKENLEQEINDIVIKKNQVFLELKNMQQKNKSQKNYFDNLKDKIFTLTNTSINLNNKLDNKLKYLIDTYFITFEYAKANYNYNNSNDDETKIRDEIKTLKFDLKKIGSVDLDAISQYENEKIRYDFFQKEYNSLNQAVTKLHKSISDMDKIMLDKFSETIKNVNIHLLKTFKVLFKGGFAKLIYEDPTDILNSGIDISITPPGKKITNINLLSGGEKSLVALAVLFAILETNPLPLVILDEVEAPLDYDNLARFSNYLHTFIDTTQFLIVTHRTPTMERCDKLFGVTMQEKGITTILLVKLKDAQKINQNSTKIIKDNDEISSLKA